jgi:hypothetical protein
MECRITGEERSGCGDISNFEIAERDLFLLILVKLGVIWRDIGSSSRRRTRCSD